MLFLGCIEKGSFVKMTMHEFWEDWENDYRGDKFIANFKSLNDGDVVIIEDEIYKMKYVNDSSALYPNMTYLYCKSDASTPLYVEGDLTKKFREGDKIKIKLHIMKEVYTKKVGDKTVTFEMEVWREGWDEKNLMIAPIPQSCISLAKI